MVAEPRAVRIGAVIRRLATMPPSRRRQWLAFKRDRLVTATLHARRLRSVGAGTIVQKPLFWTPEFIQLGERVLIWPGCRIEAVSGFADGQFEPSITIGDHVTLQQNCHVTFAGHLSIGSDSALLNDTVVTDIDHSFDRLNVNLNDQPLIVRPTKIGRFCVIGSGARILAGTMLGDNCIVGANSVVRGMFPDHCVIAGAPARIIRRFDADAGEWRRTDAEGGFA
jgi:acetyltransferase-like isoleucine patch superfamily enzyme